MKVNLTQRCLSLVHTRYHPVVQWLNPEQGVSTEEGKKVVRLSGVASRKKKMITGKGISSIMYQ